MNLLEILKNEIDSLQITDKEQIKNYIFRRIGEIFNYDPLWKFGKVIDRINIRNKHLDITNITEFNIVCFSWSHLYVDLLTCFGIYAKVVGNVGHEFVEVKINNKIFIEDLTKKFEDFTRIKYGMVVKDLFTVLNNENKKPTLIKQKKKENYKDDKITMEEVLIKIKCELLTLKKELNFQEYLYQAFKTIETIINFPRPNIGFICGNNFIDKLLKIFINNQFTPTKLHFFDNNKRIYIAVYPVKNNDQMTYFVSRETNEGYFSLHEVDYKEIETYLNNYQVDQPANLVLEKINKG